MTGTGPSLIEGTRILRGDGEDIPTLDAGCDQRGQFVGVEVGAQLTQSDRFTDHSFLV